MSKKCFLITGASSGLGKAMKDFLIAETNHDVVSLSRKPEHQDKINSRIWYVNFDLSTVYDFEFISDICDRYKNSEIIYINNAATILPFAKVGSFDRNQLLSYYQMNVIAPISLINKLVKIKRRGLTILNISSGASKRPISFWSLYCSAKASVSMFCDVLAIDHPELLVRNIDPGVINTQMQHAIRKSNIPDKKTFLDLEVNKSLKQPIDAAKEILMELI